MSPSAAAVMILGSAPRHLNSGTPGAIRGQRPRRRRRRRGRHRNRWAAHHSLRRSRRPRWDRRAASTGLRRDPTRHGDTLRDDGARGTLRDRRALHVIGWNCERLLGRMLRSAVNWMCRRGI